MSEYKIQFAELFIRCFAGILFFFQGYDKLFKVKMVSVTDTFMRDASRYNVPRFVVSFVAYFTSIIELLGGLLLVLGLFTEVAVLALCLDLLIVAFAFSFLDPMWDLRYMFPRLALLVLLLLLSNQSVLFGLDYFLRKT